MVTKMPAPAKHDATVVTTIMTASSTAAARKAEKGVNTNLCPFFEKTLKPLTLCLEKDAKKSAPAENTKKRNNIKTTVRMNTTISTKTTVIADISGDYFLCSYM
jgi:hypothetical protein